MALDFRRIFTEWYSSLMVSFSLLIQTTLLLTGSRRKYTNRGPVLEIVRFAYMFADWVALVSLSLITNSQTSSTTNAMHAFWAPFIFLHLGGADTITAYYLEDNQTWKRTFLTFSFQVVGFISAFIILTASSGHILKVLSIFVALAGIIKMCERICANMRASSDQLKKSMLTPPDPGPNYAKYMDEYCSKTAEGFKVKSEKIDDAPMVGHNFHTFHASNFVPEAANLLEANSFFEVFKCLFADLILTMHDILESQSFFQDRSSDEVFRVIEIELSFMYDLLYTKALVIYSGIGLFFRFITIVVLFSVLAAFSVADKQSFPKKDVNVSYLLLAGAVLHEIFAICLILRSDYTIMWLSKRKTGLIHLLHRAVSCSFVPHKRWCNKISQLNLISICLRENQTKNKFHRLTSKWNMVQYKAIPAELKELVFQQLLKKCRSVSEDVAGFKELCSHRGDWVIKNEGLYHILGWSVEVEFDHSVLLWHLATDLCYNAEAVDENEINDTNAGSRPNHKELCKMLSEYMAYVLVKRPYMFPDGIGQIRFRDTCAEAKEFFNERRSASGGNVAASSALMKVCTEIPPSHVKGDRSKSVLFDGCRLAKGLRSLTVAEDKKWELISHIWVEMLCYAGNHCRRDHHAQRLRRGGELLTHVWLLMAHLGITEQFQISEGHARTKLIVE